MKTIALIILFIILVGLLIKIAYSTYFAKQIAEEENEKRRQDVITQHALNSIGATDVEICNKPCEITRDTPSCSDFKRKGMRK